MYHLPKRKYAEVDSMNPITNIVDNKLDEHPQTVVVCGGDLNKLNIDRLEELTGWNRRFGDAGFSDKRPLTLR